MIGALKRLIIKEFLYSPLYSEAYRKFMDEYETLAHMVIFATYPADAIRNSYLLLHQGVLKEHSTTTKLRVMFDGSSFVQGHTSLNELLYRYVSRGCYEE